MVPRLPFEGVSTYFWGGSCFGIDMMGLTRVLVEMSMLLSMQSSVPYLFIL